MSNLESAAAIPQAWVLANARWLLILLHVPLAIIAPANVINGSDTPAANPVAASLLGLAVGGLQVRHSLAAARGERPRAWRWTYGVLIVLVYVPMFFWFSWNWNVQQIFVIASTAMLLRGWLARILIVAPVVGTGVSAMIRVLTTTAMTPWQAGFYLVYLLGAFVLFAAGLVGAARLVPLVDELYATRAELAMAAIGDERQRMSRDLHDLLGQSLSAISLKGDVAIQLLARDTDAGHREIESITAVAREALHDIRAITRDEHDVSVQAEIEGAVNLLRAAGVVVRTVLEDLSDAPAPLQEVLGWAIREGTTNILRHSNAGICMITLDRVDGGVRMEMANDGARNPGRPGTGLTGLAARVQALSGTLTTSASDGAFRLSLHVPVPEERP